MKRLIVALVAAVAFTTAFAKLTDTQSFETSFSDFVASIENEDASALVDYNSDQPSIPAPYNFDNFGSKYLALDTGDATLWRTNADDAAYFDMAMQFNPCAAAPEIDEDTKIAVYLNSSSNLVVLAGDGANGTKTNVTETTLNPGTWARLTIAKNGTNFDVYLNTTKIGTYASLTGDAAIKSVGFKGTGALDDFVARTTDPFLQNPAVIINGEGYAANQVAEALGEAAAGSTVTLLTDATGVSAVSTAAGTLDLNGKTLTLPQDSGKTASLTFTGTGAKTLKGGDLTGAYNELTITAPAGEDLTLDGMTFHASVKPNGSGNLFTATNCQFLCDFDKTGSAFTDGSSADVHSYGVLFNSNSKFTQADIVDNYFDQGRRAAVQVSFAGDLYFYGNTVVADKLTSRKDGANTRYPALQVFSNGRVFMENNTFSGQYLGEAFCMYAKEAYRFRDEAVVFNGNTVSNGVTYLWGVYDVDATGVVAVVEANVLFGANTIGDQVDLTKCIYKTTIDDAPYGPTPATLALPAGVDSVYAWTHADGAKDLYVNGTPADAVAAGTVIAVPGVEVASATCVVTPDETLKNQYTAAAGVASVDSIPYATFDDAVAALAGAADDYVTLLDNVSPTISAGTTLKVKTGTHNFTPVVAADVKLTSTPGENDIITFTATECMAKCNDTWYLTFAEAYRAALAASGNAKMVVKITDDFTPAISATYDHFYSLEFIDARDDKTEGLTINLKNSEGTAYMKSSRYFFPENAKLVLAANWEPWQTGLATGGTLEIPEGVTVSNLGSYQALEGLSNIVGAGSIAPSSAVCYWLLREPERVIPTSLRAAEWTGTLVVTGTCDKVWRLGDYGNSNSKICFNGLTTYLNSGSNNVGAVELLGDGLTINGNYSSGTWTFPGALTGSGALNVSIEDTDGGTNLKLVEFTGVTSNFAGSISFGADATNACVVFGSTGIDASDKAAKRIVTGDDAVVTVAAGKSWKSSNFMLHGNVTLNGNLRNIDDTDAGVVWNNHSSAVLTANAAGLFKFGSNVNWTGRYVVNHTLASADTAFVIPTHANATTVINGDENGEFVGFPSTGSGAPTVAGNIVLNANWTTGDGYSGDANATTFASLSGSGNLTVNDKNSYSYKLVYNLTKLDGYTGTLGGRNGKFVIGIVNVDETPSEGTRLIATNLGTYGEIAGDLKLYVNGVDTGKTLTYDANGADGAGLYYIVPKNYVAEIGEKKYETLDAAVKAATDGDVITLLGDLTLDARVEPSLGAGTTLAFNLGGHTLSRIGTSGNGSVIDVKSGNVVITNGTINCTQDDTEIVAYGVYALTARSGATLALDDLTVAVNSRAGACVYPFAGATVTINGGTYRNNTAEEYQYKTGWTGMAVNQANVATQLITIYGGSFKQVNPALGDDSWTDGEGTFLASGKVATWNASTGYWDVGDPAVKPGEKDTTKYDDAQAATNAAASVTIAVPDAVASALSSEQQNTYKGMFEKKVVDNGDGTYSVAVEMKDEVVAEVQTAVDAATATTLEKVLDVEAGADANVSVTTKPGLYYAIAVGTSLPLTAPASEAYEMATDTTKTLKVRKPTTGTAAFFRVYCSETK